MNIQETLARLEPGNDAHWTADGMPRLDIIQGLMGDGSLSRKMVIDAAPDFTRASAQAAVDQSADKAAEVLEPHEEDRAPYDTSDPSWVLTARKEDVFKDEASIVEAQGAVSDLITGWNRDIEHLKKRILEANVLQRRLDRVLQRVLATKPKDQTDPIQMYLRRQNENRARRAERAQAFVAKGISQKDLALAISGKSQIDLALGQRKPAPGTTRPNPRIPVRGTRQAGS